ncbi:apolipoprotein N-acyltransferase [Thioalkalicoccus limnaeus]|uniref:Apolipoprotein N-acyltransferase n=1 Tax=Thioalkalicoccus limnaeus TaxID=120681 RepID=A0ABV4BE20_9GAMM
MVSLPPSLPIAVSLVLAFVAGAALVLAFAPFSWYPLAFLALALFYLALRDRSPGGAFVVGWAFGLGLMGFGVSWVRISLNEFGNMDPGIANLLTALFVAAMALYYGIAGWLIHRLDRGPVWVGPLLVLPGVWVLVEWLRGWLFTGFPWLTIGYSQIDSPLAGFAPVAGVHGVSLVVAIGAGLLWGLMAWTRRSRIVAALGLGGVFLAGAGLAQFDWTRPAGAPLRASVLQANIPQSIKWDEAARLPTIEAYLQLTRDHLDSDVLVWPETALPDFLHRLRAPIIDPLSTLANERGIGIVFGIPTTSEDGEPRYHNSLVSIGGSEDVYHKRHLVPFGEYLPFRRWLGPVVEWFDVPMSDFSPGQMVRPLLSVNGQSVGVSICYEIAFPAEVIEALPDAVYLITVSNDAWFGDSLAPHQHLEIARMRALETGRPLLRATNTGISAIIDDRGRLGGAVPLFERGAFSAEIHPRSGATPFVTLGNALAIGLATALLLAGGVLSLRRRN